MSQQTGNPHCSQRELEEYEHTVKPRILPKLDPQLYAACTRNDVAAVEQISSRAISTDWGSLLLVAVFENAIDVAMYSWKQKHRLDISDEMLSMVVRVMDVFPVYRFLIESGLVDANYEIERKGTVLGIAAGRANKHSLVKYALDKGADPNGNVECKSGQKVLACAAGYSDTEMVKLLLDYGAVLRDSGALILAAQNGKIENVEFLIARGANLEEIGVVTFDMRSLPELGTALHKAVEKGRIAVIDILLQAGASLTSKNAQNKTAADIAAEKGMDEMMLARLTPKAQ